MIDDIVIVALVCIHGNEAPGIMFLPKLTVLLKESVFLVRIFTTGIIWVARVARFDLKLFFFKAVCAMNDIVFVGNNFDRQIQQTS